VSLGGYGLYLLPRDMAKLGTFWLHDGVWNGQRLLPEGWIETARKGDVDMPFPGVRYGNLFWSIPSRDAFMAVGFDRQLIIMLPKLDIVAALTGANRYSNYDGKPSTPSYSMGVVVARLNTASKPDGVLPDDPAAFEQLTDKIKAMTEEVRTEDAGNSPLAGQISGKIWRLQPNPFRIRSFSFLFDRDEASYSYDQNGRRWGGPIGLDGFYGIGGHRLFGTSAAKGRWLDDKTFQLEFQTLGNDDAAIAEFVFDDKSVTGKLSTLGGFKTDVRGEAEE
jgi:hypothetical protein